MSLELQNGRDFKKLKLQDIFGLPLAPDIEEKQFDARLQPGAHFIPASAGAQKTVPPRLNGLQSAWTSGTADPINTLQLTIQRSVDTLRWALCDDIPKLLADIGFKTSKPCGCSKKGQVNGEDELKKCPCQLLHSPPNSAATSPVGLAELSHADTLLAGMVKLFVKTHHTLAFLRSHDFDMNTRQFRPIAFTPPARRRSPPRHPTPTASGLAARILAEKAAKEMESREKQMPPPVGVLNQEADLNELFKLLDDESTPSESLSAPTHGYADLDDQFMNDLLAEIMPPTGAFSSPSPTSSASGDSGFSEMFGGSPAVADRPETDVPLQRLVEPSKPDVPIPTSTSNSSAGTMIPPGQTVLADWPAVGVPAKIVSATAAVSSFVGNTSFGNVAVEVTDYPMLAAGECSSSAIPRQTSAVRNPLNIVKKFEITPEKPALQTLPTPSPEDGLIKKDTPVVGSRRKAPVKSSLVGPNTLEKSHPLVDLTGAEDSDPPLSDVSLTSAAASQSSSLAAAAETRYGSSIPSGSSSRPETSLPRHRLDFTSSDGSVTVKTGQNGRRPACPTKPSTEAVETITLNSDDDRLTINSLASARKRRIFSSDDSGADEKAVAKAKPMGDATDDEDAGRVSYQSNSDDEDLPAPRTRKARPKGNVSRGGGSYNRPQTRSWMRESKARKDDSDQQFSDTDLEAESSTGSTKKRRLVAPSSSAGSTTRSGRVIRRSAQDDSDEGEPYSVASSSRASAVSRTSKKKKRTRRTSSPSSDEDNTPRRLRLRSSNKMQ